jgi:hypothetical protein
MRNARESFFNLIQINNPVNGRKILRNIVGRRCLLVVLAVGKNRLINDILYARTYIGVD